MNIVIETEIGCIELSLDVENAPSTTEYFIRLLEQKALDNTSFFRIVGPDSQSSLDSGVPIKVAQFGHWELSTGNTHQIKHEGTDQTGLVHSKWSLSTARYGEGQVYRSFFICLRDEPCFDFGGARHPDGLGFAKFGDVVSGHSVLEQIYNNRSVEEFQQDAVKILSIRAL